MKNKIIKKASIIGVFILLFGALLSCNQQEDYQMLQEDKFALGTYNQVTIYAPSEKEGQNIIDEVFKRVEEIENLMSTSIENSDISRLNNHAGESAVKVDSETLELLRLGKEYKDLTNGAFNIGIGALINLWDITGSEPCVPPQNEIKELLDHFNLDELKLNDEENEARIEDPEMRIDLGGIAKGYAVDEAIRIIRDRGIEHGIVDFGGDVYVLGNKPDGNEWRVGINNPEIGVSGVVGRIYSSDMSVVSSGDYERYFMENDQLYHHILDSETGYPTDNQLSSVTVISDSSIEGDVFSTAIFVMGLEDGLEFANTIEGVEAILITESKKVHLTEAAADLFEIMDKEYIIVD